MKRMSVVGLLLCVCFVPVAWGQGPSWCKFDTPLWAQFHRHNMRRFDPCETVLNVHNVGNLELKWSYRTGASVTSSPAVANGVLYVGSYDHNVYALNADTGALLWKYATGSPV